MTKHDEARECVNEQTNSSRKTLQQYIDEAEATEKELERLNEVVIPKIKAHKFDEGVKVEKELEELKKKEIPMKALHDENYHYFTCPKCGIDWGYTCEVEEHKYCGNCGQRLEFDTEDWEEEDEE